MTNQTPLRSNQEALSLVEPGWVIVKETDIPEKVKAKAVQPTPYYRSNGVTGDVLTRIDSLPFNGHRDWVAGSGVPPASLTFDIGLTLNGTSVNLDPALPPGGEIGGINEPTPDTGLQYTRSYTAGVGIWTELNTTGTDFGTGLSLDSAAIPPIVHLTPAGWAPQFLGGVYTNGARSATNGLDLAAAGTGELSVPLATDLLAGSIVEPPPDDQLYSRMRSLAGISSWVLQGPGAEFGVGLAYDEFATPPIVHLTPAGYTVAGDPAKFLGGVYIEPMTGLAVKPDGNLSGMTATPTTIGMIFDAPVDPVNTTKTYTRRFGQWVPTTTTEDMIWGIGLEETAPNTIDLLPAGTTPIDLGGVYLIPGRGLHIESDGGLWAVPAAPDRLGVILDPPFDSGNPDVVYVRKWGNWVVSNAAVDFGKGLVRDDTTTPPIVHLQPAGYTDVGNVDPTRFLGGVFVAPSTGLGLVSTTGELSGMRATPTTIGMMFDAPFDDKAYLRSQGNWIATTIPDPSAIPIAGYTAATLGAVYIVPNRAMRVEADGALDVLPASPTQLGVILDPPFNSGNPDTTYVRKWGAWIESSAAASGLVPVGRSPLNGLDSGYDDVLKAQTIYVPLATDLLAGSIVEPPADNLQYVRTRSGAGVSTWVKSTATAGLVPVGRSPLNGLESSYDTVLDAQTIYVPLATDLLAGSIVEPPPDGSQYVRVYDAATGGSWTTFSASGLITVSDTAPTGASVNTLWWDSDRGTLAINYQDVDTTQWVQIAGPMPTPADGITDAPVDGTPYSRQDASWVPATTSASGAFLPLDGSAPMTGALTVQYEHPKINLRVSTGGLNSIPGISVYHDAGYQPTWEIAFGETNDTGNMSIMSTGGWPPTAGGMLAVLTIDRVSRITDFKVAPTVNGAPVVMQASIDDVMGHIGQLTTRLAALEARMR